VAREVFCKLVVNKLAQEHYLGVVRRCVGQGVLILLGHGEQRVVVVVVVLCEFLLGSKLR
jgi:hypothetical protein